MMIKKILAFALACVMVLGIPLTAAATGTEWVVDCPAWWGGHSAPVEITEEIQSWTFTSTSYADAVNNWETPVAVVWRSDDGTMTGANYYEEIVARSDNFAWGGSAFTNYSATFADGFDWAAWIEANKAGVSCTVTAQKVGDNVVFGISNGGVTTVYIVPLNTALTSGVYLSMTGEKCTMTGWSSTNEHIDISAAVASVTPAPEETTAPTEATTVATEPSTESTEPATEPSEPATEPTEPATEPSEPATEPSEPATEPSEPATEPTEPATEPTEPATEPSEPATEPSEPATEPSEPATEPTEPSGWVVDCPAWWGGHSAPVEITEEKQSWTFTNTSYADAVNNWETPVAVIWRSDDGTMTGTNYYEEIVARSDNYAWGGSAFTNYSATFADGFDWAAWVEANKAGVSCTVTTQKVGDNVVFGISNGGVTTVYIVPLNTTLTTPVYLSMTGEKCTMTDWASTGEHIDITAAVDSLTPSEDDKEEDKEEDVPVVDETVSDWVVDCPAWWGGHTPAVKLSTTKQSWSFINTTYSSASDNWDTATVVVWRSDDGKMNGPNYLEELLVRSDSYAVSEEAFWGTSGQPSYSEKNYPSDWSAWLSANKKGAKCTITAQIVDGYIVVGFSNNGVTNVYSVPMNKSLGSDVYLSVTGEECKISNWHATNSHLDISVAASAPADGTNPSTGDSFHLALVMAVCLISFGAMVVLTKRKFAK